MNIDTKKMELLESIKEKLMGEKNKEFHFLLVGRTGVGKSSTVNSLLGKKVAEVGEYEPTTMDVKLFKSEIEGIRFTIIDTPGLCEDDEYIDNKYIALIKADNEIPQSTTLIYVTPLNETRFRREEKVVLRKIYDNFPSDFDNLWVIFTFAASIESKKLEDTIEIRISTIQDYILSFYSGFRGSIKIGVIDNVVNNWSSDLVPVDKFLLEN